MMLMDPAEPRALTGVLSKQGHGPFRQWAKRNYVLRRGILHWSSGPLSVDDPFGQSKRSFIDFSRTPCDLIVLPECSMLVLKPKKGFRWHSLDQHGSAGKCSPILLKAETNPEFKDLLREHITFGRTIRACRLAKMDSVLGHAQSESSDLEARRSTTTGGSTTERSSVEVESEFDELEIPSEVIALPPARRISGNSLGFSWMTRRNDSSVA
mmetsp:Transcript_23461/g.51464  ORF Transcript_23461/g.51464 Transcript_23461/m.51464 type:complete len:211 (+) Transcript_23461:203-835(+)